MSQPDFWNEPETAQNQISQANHLREWVQPLRELTAAVDDADVLLELAEEEENPEDSLGELSAELEKIFSQLDALELKRMLGKPNDKKNAIVSINAGAGGTEACDWADMLFRMYKRWAENHGFRVQVLDVLPGESAGIKNLTAVVRGEYAYGYLKAEKGVHRLVRISPFDANKRRHTSFASVDVSPEIEDDVAIEIEEKDLRIDTFRSSGPGGQHVNVTDSAVRMTHIPTGIVVCCQNERSQHKNRAVAMKVLRSRLYEYEMRKKEEELKKEHGAKMEIAWGSQIRSYVFQPYTMVKDHRTKMETGRVEAVMDGDLDLFIHAYLTQFG
jgi:peptide chain release factor 2